MLKDCSSLFQLLGSHTTAQECSPRSGHSEAPWFIKKHVDETLNWPYTDLCAHLEGPLIESIHRLGESCSD